MSSVFGRVVLYGLLGVMAVVTAAPLVWMVAASFMASGEASTFPPPLLSSHPTLAQYTTLFERLNLTRAIVNTAVLALAVTGVSLLINSMAGYAFAKYRFRGRDSVFRLLVTSMVIPAQVTMLPLFLMLNRLGLINTYFGVIIPGMASIYGIFLIRQYAMSIPDSLLEAARIDGAGDFRIYWTIVLPLCKPILITVALFTFMGTWNDFLWPLIVMTDDSMYTLPVALAGLSGEHVQDTELMMAGAVLTVLPVLVVFMAMQKYYIGGIMAGGTKE
jgi:multiple sugar transport system permease protein